MDITALIVGIVLGLFAIITGTLEFLDRMGFPTPLQKKRDEKNKRIIRDTLQEVGLYSHKKQIRQLGELIKLRESVSGSYAIEVLDEIITQYTRKVDIEVGLTVHTQISYYIAFEDALTHPENGRILTSIMCGQIVRTLMSFSDSPFTFDKIAVSKTGTTALALRVALELQKPWVFIDLRGSTIASDTIEGRLDPGDEVIIVHDIFASGKLPELMARELHKKQAQVKHVFVLVERTDTKSKGKLTPSELLSKSGLELHRLITINDQQLGKRLS